MTEQYEKRHEAVALSFDPTDGGAPKVLAKGKGKIAENILEQAKIQEDPSLVQLLGQLDLNESIPEELYQAVAEVFAFIYRLERTYDGVQKKIR